MKIISKLIVCTILFGLCASCVKKEEQTLSDLDKLRTSNNKTSYPAVQMDSAQAINSITKQKIEQLLELSTLYLSGNKNTEIDTLILSQMKNYFQTPDSMVLKPMLSELDSLQVKKVKVNSVEVYKEVINEDTLDLAKFNVEYYDKRNKSIGRFDKNARYILVSKDIQFKKEFKFYFVNFYQKPSKKDSTSVGVTK